MPKTHLLMTKRVAIAVITSLAIANVHAENVTITDDAGRSATLQAPIERVFAAGFPAEILVYTLAPERLVGRNHPPSAAAREFVPEQLRDPIVIHTLPARDSAAQDAEFLQSKPQLFLDYGELDEDYLAAVTAVSTRTGVPALTFDARLERVPQVYRTLGKLLGVADRGELLARESERLLERYAGPAARTAGKPGSVYFECSDDRQMPCLSNEIAGEVIAMAGGRNVADTIPAAGERPLSIAEVAAADPDVIVAANATISGRILNSDDWRQVRAVREGKVFTLPAQPFSWSNRPPSVNRLPSLLWAWYVVRQQAFDERFFEDLTSFYQNFYHVRPSRDALRSLVSSAAK